MSQQPSAQQPPAQQPPAQQVGPSLPGSLQQHSTYQGPTRLEIKLAKWWIFSLAVVGLTVVVDIFAALAAPGTPNFVTVLGGGDLFAASLGLSAAAMGDMICDRFFAPNPKILHLKWLGVSLACTLLSAIAYFWAKESLGLAAFIGDKAPNVEALKGFEDSAFWITLLSPATCIVVASLAFQAVKRSEP